MMPELPWQICTWIALHKSFRVSYCTVTGALVLLGSLGWWKAAQRRMIVTAFSTSYKRWMCIKARDTCLRVVSHVKPLNVTFLPPSAFAKLYVWTVSMRRPRTWGTPGGRCRRICGRRWRPAPVPSWLCCTADTGSASWASPGTYSRSRAWWTSGRIDGWRRILLPDQQLETLLLFTRSAEG